MCKRQSALPVLSLLAIVLTTLYSVTAYPATQITFTANTVNESWSVRNRSTSSGQILWFDSGGDVYLYNGSSNVLLQAKGGLTGIGDNVFMLGSGSSPGSVIGAWRRDTDFAWVSMNGNAPVRVSAVNPIDATQATNPEALAIEDGCVFMTLQAFANAQTVKHVFKVNPVTGAAANLTGTGAVPGSGTFISTSQCKAVWSFNDGTTVNNQVIYKLHYYDGATVATIDSDSALGNPIIWQGRIYYSKTLNGARHVFLYDTTAPSPLPVQLTSMGDLSLDSLTTDGRYLAWRRQSVTNGTWQVAFLGGATLPEPSSVTGIFGLHRGQILWGTSTSLRFADAGAVSTINLSPATTFSRPWLQDSYAAWFGTSSDGGTDTEVFRHAAPAEILSAPVLAVEANAGIGVAQVSWSQIHGASSYNVYMARSSGVTRDNYLTLAGGQKYTNVSSPLIVSGLTAGQTVYFVVTATENTVEGASSREVSVTPPAGWALGFGTAAFSVYDVKADSASGNILYAAVANAGRKVWRSTDAGMTWTGLTGTVNDRDIRAVAANGNVVLAVTKDGDVLRSTDTGASWNVVADGSDIGETQKSIAIDPLNPSTIYAGDLKLIGTSANYLCKSIDGGSNWSQFPDAASGEIRAYSIAIDTVTPGTLYIGGTGTPVAKSLDGGATWVTVQPSAGYFYAVAVNPSSPTTVYAAATNFSATSIGVYKSTNGGSNWTQKNNGFPIPPPVIRSLVVDGSNVYAGSDSGYYVSTNGGDTWSLGPGGAYPSSSLIIRAMALTPSKRLVAATASGIYVLAPTVTPTVSSINATSGAVSGGDTVTVSGVGFNASPGLRVLLGESDGVVNLGASNATSITLATPAHAAGVVDVTVINPDGQSAMLIGAFTYVGCTYGIAPIMVSLSSSASNGTVQVSTGAGCAWTATVPGGSFVSITNGSSGSGPGSVSYSVTQNSGSTARTATMTVAGRSFAINQNASGLAAFALNAQASATQVSLSWASVSGATSYEVRRSSGGVYNLVTTTGGLAFADTTVFPGTGYLYVIHAISTSGVIAYSNVDLAVPFTYTDASLSTGTIIRGAHFVELRAAINAARTAIGLSALAFTDTNLSGLMVRRVHLTELRSGVDGVRGAVGLAPPVYSDPSITAGTTLIRAGHVTDLRSGLQ